MVQQPPGPPGGMQPPPPPPPGQPPQGPAGPPRPQLDMSNLPLADIIVAGSALLFVILTGIGWYGEEGVRRIGAMGGLALAVGILTLLFAAAMVLNNYLNFIPIDLPVGPIYVIATAVALFFMVIGIFVKPTTFGFKWPLSWPVWIIALIFAIGMGVGSVMKVQQS